jgi:hypothetical protein
MARQSKAMAADQQATGLFANKRLVAAVVAAAPAEGAGSHAAVELRPARAGAAGVTIGRTIDGDALEESLAASVCYGADAGPGLRVRCDAKNAGSKDDRRDDSENDPCPLEQGHHPLAFVATPQCPYA